MRALMAFLLASAACSAHAQKMPEECRGWWQSQDQRYSAVDVADAIITATHLPAERHEETLRCLEALWLKRDGAAPWELAEAFIRVLIENPGLFISHVAAKHELYRSWLDNIDEYNFRAFNDDTKRLKETRRKALKSLRSVSPKDSAGAAVKRELIEKIRKAKITSVD